MNAWTSVEDDLPKVGRPVWIRTVARGREDRDFIGIGMRTTQGGGAQWADVRRCRRGRRRHELGAMGL